MWSFYSTAGIAWLDYRKIFQEGIDTARYQNCHKCSRKSATNINHFIKKLTLQGPALPCLLILLWIQVSLSQRRDHMGTLYKTNHGYPSHEQQILPWWHHVNASHIFITPISNANNPVISLIIFLQPPINNTSSPKWFTIISHSVVNLLAVRMERIPHLLLAFLVADGGSEGWLCLSP